jgi:4-hydroxybenzoate polyprenyltransferase
LIVAGAGPPAFAGLAAFALHLAWQTSRIRCEDGGRALALFRSNRDAGLLLFAGLVVDGLFRTAVP